MEKTISLVHCKTGIWCFLRCVDNVYLILSGESSRSFFLNLLSVSSMVLPILSLISPSFSLKGKAPLLLSQSSSHLVRSNSLAEVMKNREQSVAREILSVNKTTKKQNPIIQIKLRAEKLQNKNYSCCNFCSFIICWLNHSSIRKSDTR